MKPPTGAHTGDRRAIAAGLIVCAAILVLGRGIPALRSAELNARHRLHVARARVSGLQPLPAITNETKRESTTTQLRYIRRPSVAEVTAELSRHVTMLARFAGVSILSVTPVQESRDADRFGPFVTAVTISATGHTRAVLEFLRELELGKPVVGVAVLRLARQGASSTDDLMRIELTLRAVAEISRGAEGQ